MINTLKIELKPSIFGYVGKYFIYFTIFIFLEIYKNIILNIIGIRNNIILNYIILFILIIIIFIIAWIFNIVEVQHIIILFFILVIIFKIFNKVSLLNIDLCLLLSTLLNILNIEIHRQSLKYLITDSGIYITYGIIKKYDIFIPYNGVNKIILEQSIFGKIFNYGTIILICSIDDIAENNIKAFEVDIFIGKYIFGKIHKKLIKDPLKCLYNIKNPKYIKNIIENKISKK